MRSKKGVSSDKDNIQISKLKVGNSRKRKALNQHVEPSSHSDSSQYNGEVHSEQLLGLRDETTWELSDSEEAESDGDLCDEGQQLFDAWDRRFNISKSMSDEERSIIRSCSKVDAGRKDFRTIRRYTSRYGREELRKTGEIPAVPPIESTKGFKEGFGTLGTIKNTRIRPGFSYTGSVDEQQLEWFPQTFQTETVMAVGSYQPWEDELMSEADEKLENLLGSSGSDSS